MPWRYTLPVQKRKTTEGVRYRYDKIVRGHRLMSPSIYLTRQEAFAAERGAVTAFLQGKETPLISADTSETVLDLLNRRMAWIKDHRGEFHFSSTQTLFRRALKFAPQWCELHPSQITVKDVEEWAEKWAADLAQRGKTRYDVNKALVALQSAWNAPWGRRRGTREYSTNPFSCVDRFPIEKQARYIPTIAEATRVLGAATGVGKIYLRIMADTGARPSEARTMKWQDVGDGYVVLYTRKKRGGDRTPRRIQIPEDLSSALDGLRTFRPESIYVFQQSGDREAPHVHRWAHNVQIRACKDAQIPYFKLHSWRHYHASRLAAEQDLSLPQIQRRLGHEAATTTDRYLHEIRGV